MNRLDKNNIETLSAEDKQRILLSFIPMLPSFPKKNGNEGEVFFVSENLIIKKYFSKIDNNSVLQYIFNKYCQECEYFYNKGYNIPKIYTWTVLSRADHTGFDYYLLEERVPGRELFISNISRISDRFIGALDKNEFNKLIANPQQNMPLYNEILNSYVYDFLSMNERIECMSETNLERFLISVHNMFAECMYALPDVHARNVLYNEDNLQLIDLYLETYPGGYKYVNYTPPELLLLSRIVTLFNHNADIKKYKVNDRNFKKINDNIDLNETLCTEALIKVIKTAKKFYEFHPNKRWWKGFIERLEKVVNRENAAKVIKEIEPEIL